MAATPRFGLGLRAPHLEGLLAEPAGVEWLELLTDNHLAPDRAARTRLEALRARFPLALHGIGLDIAGEGPSAGYLGRVRELADALEPGFVSDHLCWTRLDGVESHDLLPVARTRELLELVCGRVARVQDALGRRLLLENATAYAAFRGDELDEGELLRALCLRTGCGVLLDVNNLLVNAHNLGDDPQRVLDALRPEDVGYLHVAGHAVLGDVRIDTHDAAVPDEVWSLAHEAGRRFPGADVLLERDDRLPALAELKRELAGARAGWPRVGWDELRAAAPVGDRGGSGRPLDAVRTGGAAAGWRAARSGFWRQLLGEGQPTGRDPEPSPLLDPARPLSAGRGLRVYREAYVESARRALAAHFPSLLRALGERDFAELAAAYLAAHPSRSGDRVAFGRALPGFLAQHPPALDRGVPVAALVELAALEQAQLEVQQCEPVAGAVAPAALLALRAEEWDGLTVRLAGAHRLLRASHDLEPALAAAARGEPLPHPQPTPTAYLLTRQREGAQIDALDPLGADALCALDRGARFAEACAGESGVAAAVAALALACARGAVQALRPGPAPRYRRPAPHIGGARTRRQP